MDDRRKTLRRKADCDLVETVNRLKNRGESITVEEYKPDRRSRRRAIRHNCTALIKISGAAALDDKAAWSNERFVFKGRVLDLSPLGAMLFMQEATEPGRNVYLKIQMRDGAEIFTSGDVRWVKSLPEKGGYAVGVHFADMTPESTHLVRLFLHNIDVSLGL